MNVRPLPPQFKITIRKLWKNVRQALIILGAESFGNINIEQKIFRSLDKSLEYIYHIYLIAINPATNMSPFLCQVSDRISDLTSASYLSKDSLAIFNKTLA